jgi:hypothetical protein
VWHLRGKRLKRALAFRPQPGMGLVDRVVREHYVDAETTNRGAAGNEVFDAD